MFVSPSQPRWPLSESLHQDVDAACRSDLPVLISVDSTLIATALAYRIHAGSARSAAPIVVMDAARTTLRMQDLLFERLRGIQTDSQLPGGTLLVTRVDRMPLPVQRGLLRFMDLGESGRVPPARIIAAARRSAFRRIEGGQFSEALFYRLNTIHICLGRLGKALAETSAARAREPAAALQ
jgi:anaerobic nitric oxide reductase transcription regulator